ncbi:3-hydroxybenzoate 4-monooxygenase [Salinisphaera sp. USBA-960]|nr:3-hydroxybenzoate 4-monooxygenase [Salifodinibacter halophilus]NNC25802.1 3-hydroxybenzoate 4-monooxygenase [Salifodinibacter halophilus]
MQFHHYGYVTGDPRIEQAAGVGIDRPVDLPDEVDVLVLGAGPAGVVTTAQLSQFPEVTTRLIEARPHRLGVGQADGIQARSVETFQAFGFANRIIEEAYRITEMAFWRPDPDNPSCIKRQSVPIDDPGGISEFPHLIVNQARVQDHFVDFMKQSPARLEPDYGIEFVRLDNNGQGDYPVAVRVRYTAGERQGEERTVHARYVVGCDGAHSKVRKAIGRKMAGQQAAHAWGVIDVLVDTDFPDIRTKCIIQSKSGGNILHIPREGGHLFRMYVDLGEVATDEQSRRVQETTFEETVAKANEILHPYQIDVKSLVRYSVYEVGHRLTDKFDDVDDPASQTPRVFITGDACHTHSAKAGQGMNVSIQDGFNIGWKLGHVVQGISPESLLNTYSTERKEVAKNLIDFDQQWSNLMATPEEDFDDPAELEDFYVKTFEFPAGFMTEYQPSMITGKNTHQHLATGFPIGKRFHSAPVIRVCDANPLELGHQARADGRWHIYVFADNPATGPAAVENWASWVAGSSDSPVRAHTPAGAGFDSLFDIKVIYQQLHRDVEINNVPTAFLPRVGPFELTNREKIFAVDANSDIFDARGIDRRQGAVIVVRPDQYVAHVLPLTATDELVAFFNSCMQHGSSRNE